MAKKLTPAQKAAKTRAASRKERLQKAVKAWEQRKKATAAYAKRSAAAKKGWETRRAIERGKKCIDTLKKMISNWSPQPYWSESMVIVKTADKNSLEALLNISLANYGEREVAMRLEKDADQNLDYADTILWDSNEDHVDTAKAHLIELLNRGPMDAQKSKDFADRFTKEELAEANAELDFLLG